MRKLMSVAALSAGMLVMLGCAGHTAAPGSAQPAPPSVVNLVVHNHNWSDVTIYVVYHGVSTRVGSVTATDSATFKLRPTMIGTGDIQLAIAPLGSVNVEYTDPIMVQLGQTIDLKVENQLGLTNWTILG